MQMAAQAVQADLILVDIGPNLGAINRSALLATDYVAIPLGADLFSLQGLGNLGPALRSWKGLWKKRLDNWKESGESCRRPDFLLPDGKMQPIGYLCQQHGVRLERPPMIKCLYLLSDAVMKPQILNLPLLFHRHLIKETI